MLLHDIPYQPGSFSFTDGTCSYYYYWVDVATDDSVTISDDSNVFVRKNRPGMTIELDFVNVIKLKFVETKLTFYLMVIEKYRLHTLTNLQAC